MYAHFNTIVGWPVKEDKIVEQYNKRFKTDDDEIFHVGTCLRILPKLMINSGCPVIKFSSERHEDRKANGIFILTIYDDPKEPGIGEIEAILKAFPPIFNTIKKDLGIEGDPRTYLKEP